MHSFMREQTDPMQRSGCEEIKGYVRSIHPGACSKSLRHDERGARTDKIKNHKNRQPHIVLMADLTQTIEQLRIEMHLLCRLDRRVGTGLNVLFRRILKIPDPSLGDKGKPWPFLECQLAFGFSELRPSANVQPAGHQDCRLMNDFETARQCFFEGLQLLEANNLQAAETQFARSLELIPERVSTLNNLSAVKIKLTKFGEAQNLARKAVELDEKSPEAWS